MEIQSSYFSYLFALGLGQSVMLTAALLKSGQRKSLTRIFFLMILIIMGVEILYGLLYQTRSIYDFPHLLRINTFLVLCFGPALYLAMDYYFNPKKVFSRYTLLHFLPGVLTFIYFVPLFLSSADTKIEYLNVMFEGTHRDSFIFGGARRIQQGIYLVLMIRMLWSEKSRVNLDLTGSYFRPLFALFLLFSFMWAFDIYRYFFQFDLFTGVVNTVLMSSLLLYLTFKVVSRESFFKEHEVEKYASSGLSKEGEVNVLEKIKAIFEAEKTYTNPSLTLSKLSSELELPSAYISQSVNNQLGVNYGDFVNEWRVKEAKRLLENPGNHNLKLFYIAQKAGFKSSSTFNSAFKKVVGITPSDFRNRHA